MVPLNENNDFTTAWRALAGSSSTKDGWQSIPIISRLSCRLLAARHFPGNEEAILIGFRSVGSIANEQLPEGSGFLVRMLNNVPDQNECKWIALLRQPAGSLEIFTMMSLDIVSTLEVSEGADDDQLLGIFLSRIRAWQRFMQRGRDGVLSSEAEIGLHGELIVLALILRAGTLPHKALDAWRGPREGLHDFQLSTGALEVKTTLSQNSFPATISSLEQMDNRLVSPLYLAGVRLRMDESGKNLKERYSSPESLDRKWAKLSFFTSFPYLRSRPVVAAFSPLATDLCPVIHR